MKLGIRTLPPDVYISKVDAAKLNVSPAANAVVVATLKVKVLPLTEATVVPAGITPVPEPTVTTCPITG